MTRALGSVVERKGSRRERVQIGADRNLDAAERHWAADQY